MAPGLDSRLSTNAGITSLRELPESISSRTLPCPVLAKRPEDIDSAPERATLLSFNADGSCKVSFPGGVVSHALHLRDLTLGSVVLNESGRRLTQAISLFRETMDLDVDPNQPGETGAILISRVRRRQKLTKLLEAHQSFIEAAPTDLRFQIAYPEDNKHVDSSAGTYTTSKMECIKEANEIMDKTCGKTQKKTAAEAEPSGLDTEMVQEQEQEQEHSIEIEAVEEEQEEVENNFLKVWGKHWNYAYADILDLDKHENQFPRMAQFGFNNATPPLPFPDELRLSRNFAPIDYAGDLVRPLKNVNVVVYVEMHRDATGASASTGGRVGHAVVVTLLEAQMLRTCLFDELGDEDPSKLLEAQGVRSKKGGKDRPLTLCGMCTVAGTWLWKHPSVASKSSSGPRVELQGWKFEPPRSDDDKVRQSFAQLLYCAKFFNAEFYFKAHEVMEMLKIFGEEKNKEAFTKQAREDFFRAILSGRRRENVRFKRTPVKNVLEREDGDQLKAIQQLTQKVRDAIQVQFASNSGSTDADQDPLTKFFKMYDQDENGVMDQKELR